TTRAVTVGYGPRFLHSTGQLHKGGRDNGIFLQITVDDAVDLPIPGKPYSFSVLKNAQAMGDQEALMRRRLPFVRLHIQGDIPAGLARILEAVEAAEEKQI
ncbi:MAG: glucose-6-phosphate isomerase, partial [Anaerolineae bacterium]|nr:glucose-6-phosphate isomerase [Anaerolineae bacterium]